LDVREFESNKTRVFVEVFLLERSQFAHNLLDAEKLVNFRLAREKCVTICDFAHDAARSPNVYFLPVMV